LRRCPLHRPVVFAYLLRPNRTRLARGRTGRWAAAPPTWRPDRPVQARAGQAIPVRSTVSSTRSPARARRYRPSRQRRVDPRGCAPGRRRRDRGRPADNRRDPGLGATAPCAPATGDRGDAPELGRGHARDHRRRCTPSSTSRDETATAEIWSRGVGWRPMRLTDQRVDETCQNHELGELLWADDRHAVDRGTRGLLHIAARSRQPGTVAWRSRSCGSGPQTWHRLTPGPRRR